MLNLKNSFSGHKVLLLFLAKSEFVYLLKTAQQSEKGTGCSTPKENINIIHYSLFGTQLFYSGVREEAIL